MKRMRFLAIIFTLLIGIVGSNFTTPERVFAAYVLPTPQQYEPYLTASTNLAGIFYDAGFQSSYNQDQKTVYASYFQILKAAMANKAKELAGGGYEDGAFQINVLNDFEKYLNSAKSAITDPATLKVNADTLALVSSAHTKASNDQLTDAGLIAMGGGTTVSDQSAAQLQSAASANLAKTQAEGAVESCKLMDIGCYANKFFIWLIQTFFLELAGFMVWLSANMMNYAIKIGILEFAKWAPNTLYPIWLVVRQITSLFVVFAGLWLGFMYIINKGKEFEKYIPFVILFGLFVNFSYPLVRTVIDVSNVVSLNLYASSVGNNAITAKATDGNTAGAIIMSKIGLQGLVFSATKGSNPNDSEVGKLTKANSIPGALMAVGFVFYAAYVFFIITFLIVTRTAVLVFIIIASPLLFVDSVIPKLGEYASKLRGIFWEMLFVGPVFAIMLALTLKFLDAFNGIKEKGVTAGGEATIVEFFNILMMLIMLHIMFKVTKATAGSIGQVVSGAMGSVGTLAVGGVAGLGMRAGFAGMAAAGRGTLGRAGSALQGSAWATKTEGFGSGASRALFRASGAMANANYDARNTSVVQRGGNMLGISSGMGAGNKLGREALIDARAKEDRIRRNFARSSTDTKNQRVKDDYNAITDKEGKKNFLNNLQKTNTALYTEIAEGEKKKALATYKAFEDNEQGRKEKFEFYSKQDPETRKRLDEFETKTEMDKDDKRAQRQDSKEATQAMKDLASAMNPKNQRLGGEDPNKGSSGLGAESVASHTAQTKYVAPRPVDAPVPQGYVEQGGLLVPTNMKASTAPQTTSAQQTAPAPSRLSGGTPDASPVENAPKAPAGSGGASSEVDHKEDVSALFT